MHHIVNTVEVEEDFVGLPDRYYPQVKASVDDFHKYQDLGMIPSHGDFIPAVHYPPITRYPEITQEDMFRGYNMPEDGLIDIYVHIPFCPKRCIYCHYPSIYGGTDAQKDEYLAAMETEMDIYLRQLNISRFVPRTILIGGGTPTDLTPAQLKHFLTYFTNRVDLSSCRQFNYDVDPWTLVGPDGLERLKIMRDFGVDRLTIGIQSLTPEIIRKMNRAHDKAVALESIQNTLDYGYQLDIEFIFGYPMQTYENWIRDLEEAVTLGAHEIQVYRLKLEAYGDQTGIIKTVRDLHPNSIPSPEMTIALKNLTVQVLAEHGYHENLRRVFTKEKKYISRYAFNQCCNLYDQIGLGQTAFSSLRNRFALNTQFFPHYYKSIEEGRLPVNRGYVRNEEAQQRWAAILPLKNYWIRKNHYKKVTGVAIEDSVVYPWIQCYKEYGLVTEDEKHIHLTPVGGLFADETVELMYELPFIPFEPEFYKNGPLNPYLLNTTLI